MVDHVGTSAHGADRGGLRVPGRLVALGGAPAHADEDRVRVRSAGSFTAGRSAAGVTVEVRKRTDGCVRVRTALGLSLPGVRADQVAVQANVGGRWVPVGVSGAAGLVTTEPVAPARDELCKGKGVAMRYRVASPRRPPVAAGGDRRGDHGAGAVLGRAPRRPRLAVAEHGGGRGADRRGHAQRGAGRRDDRRPQPDRERVLRRVAGDVLRHRHGRRRCAAHRSVDLPLPEGSQGPWATGRRIRDPAAA